MSGSHDGAAGDARRQAAAAWHVRLASADVSERDWVAFEQWLSAPGNREAYDRIEAALLALDDHRGAIVEQLAAASDNVVSFPAKRMKLSAAWVSAAAAAIALVFVGAKLLAPPAEQHFAYAAPADSARKVTLADASVVNLNRGASIDFYFSSVGRRVSLKAGEASFAVKHDAARPFSVETSSGQITDIGTEFNVLDRAGVLTVTVREGVVNVAAAHSAPTRVEKGQQFKLDAAHGQATLATVNPDDAFAWREGRLVYHNASLADVVADISRYGGRTVSVADAPTGALRFTGVLVIDKPEAMIARLVGFLPIRSTQDAKGITLRSR